MPRGKKKSGGGTGSEDKPPEDSEPVGEELAAGGDEEDELSWETSYSTEGLDLSEPEAALAVDLAYSGLTAADVMTSEVITVRPETTMEEVSELFQIHNINGAPVVDEEGMLVGIVTEDDVVVGGMGFSDEELDSLETSEDPLADEPGTAGPAPDGPPDAAAAAELSPAATAPDADSAPDDARRVAEIMTPRPIAVEEATPVEELCRLMWKLKIHRVPIVNEGRVRGIVSTIDICRLVVEGRARLIPVD